MKYLFVALICGLLTTVTMAFLMFCLDKIGVNSAAVINSPFGCFIAAIINLAWYLDMKEWILK